MTEPLLAHGVPRLKGLDERTVRDQRDDAVPAIPAADHLLPGLLDQAFLQIHLAPLKEGSIHQGEPGHPHGRDQEPDGGVLGGLQDALELLRLNDPAMARLHPWARDAGDGVPGDDTSLDQSPESPLEEVPTGWGVGQLGGDLQAPLGVESVAEFLQRPEHDAVLTGRGRDELEVVERDPYWRKSRHRKAKNNAPAMSI